MVCCCFDVVSDVGVDVDVYVWFGVFDEFEDWSVWCEYLIFVEELC